METSTPFGATTAKKFIRRQHAPTLVHPPLRRTLLILCLVLLHSMLIAPNTVNAQDTPDYFRDNCYSCHTIGGGRITGPDLKNVLQRQKREWLVNFMMDPRGVIDSGDLYAQKIFEASQKVYMTNVRTMTRERADKLLGLIEEESKLEKSHFPGLQISDRPFTDKDRSLGRNIFLGLSPLKEGGTACISCHSVHGLSALGGGRLGPDLTDIFEKKGRKSLSAWLAAPATETMQPIFKDHLMEQNEILCLVAHFEELAGEQPASPSVNRVTFLLLGLVLSSALVLVFDSLWKERFSGVRRSLVEQSTTQKPNSPQEH
jgi:cytochrome c2